MSLLWLLCALQLWGVATPESGDSPFIEPTFRGKNVEFYDTANARYCIFLDKVSYQEAKIMCNTWNGSLLELAEDAVAEFIAQALAESAVGVSSLWIGGEYSPAIGSSPGVWQWISGENIIKEPIPEGFRFPMDTPPYWVDRPDLNSTEPACLVTDRFLHHRLLITGLPCNIRRPFICSLAPNHGIKVPVETLPPIVSGKRRIHVFHAEHTWAEAFGYCKTLGYKLAVVTRQEEFTKLQNRMRHVRPIMENAWIGGAYINSKWIWVSTSLEIGNNDATPWYNPASIAAEGCLLADRHLCDYFAYVEARCDRRRSFICEEVEREVVETPLVRVEGGGGLYVSTVKLTWQEAQAMCNRCLDNGTLLQLAVNNVTKLTLEIQWLYKAMTQTIGTEIRHIWLNGYLHGHRFTWGNSSDSLMDNTSPVELDTEPNSNSSNSLLNDNGEHGSLIFCPGDFKADPTLKGYKCLNMDRENQKTFFMYGLLCSYKQHFVCMSRDDGADHRRASCETALSMGNKLQSWTTAASKTMTTQMPKTTTPKPTTPSTSKPTTKRSKWGKKISSFG